MMNDSRKYLEFLQAAAMEEFVPCGDNRQRVQDAVVGKLIETYLPHGGRTMRRVEASYIITNAEPSGHFHVCDDPDADDSNTLTAARWIDWGIGSDVVLFEMGTREKPNSYRTLSSKEKQKRDEKRKRAKQARRRK